MRKPKRPKVNASLSTWKRYEQKLKDWEVKKKLIDRLRAK